MKIISSSLNRTLNLSNYDEKTKGNKVELFALGFKANASKENA